MNGSIQSPEFPPDFHRNLGIFHCLWMMFDVVLDLSIQKMLGVTSLQAHTMLSGMEFGRKLQFAKNLLNETNLPNKSEMISAIMDTSHLAEPL